MASWARLRARHAGAGSQRVDFSVRRRRRALRAPILRGRGAGGAPDGETTPGRSATSLAAAGAARALESDLNPIELAFSKLKRLLRAAAARTAEALEPARRRARPLTPPSARATCVRRL